MSRTITTKVIAYTSEYGPGPEELATITDASQLAYLPADRTHFPKGWSKVGTGEITVTIDNNDALIANKVNSLKAELQSVRAEAQIKENELQDKIQRLLAITNEVSA